MKVSLISDMNVLIALQLSSVSVLLAKELDSHNGELNAGTDLPVLYLDIGITVEKMGVWFQKSV